MKNFYFITSFFPTNYLFLVQAAPAKKTSVKKEESSSEEESSDEEEEKPVPAKKGVANFHLPIRLELSTKL